MGWLEWLEALGDVVTIVGFPFAMRANGRIAGGFH